MVYLRSIIAGVLVLLLAAALVYAIAIVGVGVFRGSDGIGIDLPRWHFVVGVNWLLPIVIFGAGFYWEYRRLSK